VPAIYVIPLADKGSRHFTEISYEVFQRNDGLLCCKHALKPWVAVVVQADNLFKSTLRANVREGGV
jgi:hypothetical protein